MIKITEIPEEKEEEIINDIVKFLDEKYPNIIYAVTKISKPVDPRPQMLKHSITACVNCNTPCQNGSAYKPFPDTNSDACASRVFAGDDELYSYIASQHD